MKLLLFDIDGTLLRASDTGIRAMEETGKALFGESFSFQGIDASGKIDPQIYLELAAANSHLDMLGSEELFRDAYVTRLEQALRQVPENFVLPGITDLLSRVRKKAPTLGLLTGNYSLAVPLKLRAAAFEPDWFPITAFGDEGRSRNDLPVLAMQKYREYTGQDILPEEVMVIGDTPRDVECAKVNACYAFAVATGRWSFAELERSGADRVVHDFRDPEPLLSLLS